MFFFDRIARSFDLAKSSWRVLMTDKKLVIFPMLSGICCLLVLASFAVPALLNLETLKHVLDDAQNNGGKMPPWVYVVAFAYYFCNYFVIVFFNSALVSCALVRFNGGEPTLGDGLRAAASRLPQIIAWALVSATVGLVLKAIENAHERAGQFISAILGTAWTVVTYFVVPVLVVERVGPFQAVGRSLSILRHTWGEALIGSWGLGFFKFLLALPLILLVIVGVFCLAHILPLGLAVLALAGVYLVFWMAVGSALDGIYLSALYQYATEGQTPVEFDREELSGAFRSR